MTLSTISLICVAAALAATLYYRRKVNNFIRDTNNLNELVRKEIKDCKSKIDAYHRLCSNQRTPWIISQRQPGQYQVVRCWHHVPDGDNIYICAKSFRYDSEDSRQYALLCAEELCDKLNEKI